MKRFFAILLLAALTLSLTGCFGKSNSSAEEPSSEPPALSTYAKDYFGLQQYLVDYGLVPEVDLKKYNPATPNEPAEDESSGVRTKVYYDLVGADRGIRFNLNGAAFIEIYEYTNADNALAKQILADLKAEKKITVEGNPDELTGKVSKSGNFVILYNEKNSYDYDEITKVLENW